MTGPYWVSDEGDVTLHLGDCLDVMAGMPDASVDSICTDPPYAIGFMGKEWDSPGKSFVERKADRGNTCDHVGGNHNPVNSADAARTRRVEAQRFQQWCEQWAAECLRVLKPGGHMLAFGGTRTWHRLACAVEDAGFEIRDSVADLTGVGGPGLLWLCGSGFPKSLDVGKAIDKAAGAEREVVAEGTPVKRMIPGNDQNRTGSWIKDNGREFVPTVTTPATDAAAQWDGWGTALKPAWEPIVVGRKPLAGTVAENVLAFGTGALNIDACRVEHSSAADLAESQGKNRHGDFGTAQGGNHVYGDFTMVDGGERANYDGSAGRWPPNVVIAHSPACRSVGTKTVRSDGHHPASRDAGGLSTSGHAGQVGLAERASGTEVVEAWECAEFCPVAELDRQSGVSKSSGGAGVASTRNRGVQVYSGKLNSNEVPGAHLGGVGDVGGASRFLPVFNYQAKAGPDERPRLADGTTHPTVKPRELMEWLVRLVTPPGGLVLDPFAGSGTTAEACVIHGFRCVLIEKDERYAELIKTRLRKPIQIDLFGGAA